MKFYFRRNNEILTLITCGRHTIEYFAHSIKNISKRTIIKRVKKLEREKYIHSLRVKHEKFYYLTWDYFKFLYLKDIDKKKNLRNWNKIKLAIFLDAIHALSNMDRRHAFFILEGEGCDSIEEYEAKMEYSIALLHKYYRAKQEVEPFIKTFLDKCSIDAEELNHNEFRVKFDKYLLVKAQLQTIGVQP